MTRQKYIPQDNKWIIQPEFDKDKFRDNVYADVGYDFPLTILSDGKVVIDTNELPGGVSESDVKQAVKDNHPHR